MADKSLIEWTDATWNPITGCSIVSPGCTHCYAMKLAGGRLQHHPTRAGLTKPSKAGPVWTGEVRLNRSMLLDPLRWAKPRKIFVCAHGDLFAEGVPDEWIDEVFAVMSLCPQHTFQVLTKRPARMSEYLRGDQFNMGRGMQVALTLAGPLCDDDDPEVDAIWSLMERAESKLAGPFMARWPLRNVWLGVSAEDQNRADERIPLLLDTPAGSVRFLSLEPLLGPIDLNSLHQEFDGGLGHSWESCLNGKRFDPWSDGDIEGQPKIDWVIVGGESGHGARPMHPAWARSLRDQCAAADVPFFFKQWGAWVPCEPDSDAARGNPRSGWKAVNPKGRVPVATELYPENGAAHVAYVGKKAAGRLLDGVEHNGMPS